MEPWQILASVGIVLSLAEFFTPTFFALPAGLAFMATAVLAGFTQNWTVLGLALAVDLGLVYLIFYRFVWPRLQKHAPKMNADAMAGKLALVSEAIVPSTGAGEVKLYGDTWRVISKTAFDVGAHVKIVRTEGNRVVVEAAPESTD